MSRADKARFDLNAEERDRLAHQRRNEPPTPFDDDPEAWESRCHENRTHNHQGPSHKLADRWCCAACGRWLRPKKGRT